MKTLFLRKREQNPGIHLFRVDVTQPNWELNRYRSKCSMFSRAHTAHVWPEQSPNNEILVVEKPKLRFSFPTNSNSCIQHNIKKKVYIMSTTGNQSGDEGDLDLKEQDRYLPIAKYLFICVAFFFL